jgi:hypothetical protein
MRLRRYYQLQATLEYLGMARWQRSYNEIKEILPIARA